VRRLHPGPYLNEFAVQVPDARAVHRRLLDRGFVAGLALADVEPDRPELADGLLLCATELTTADHITGLRDALGAEIAMPAGAGR
jgi:glycine dehydrogenase subunit 1